MYLRPCVPLLCDKFSGEFNMAEVDTTQRRIPLPGGGNVLDSSAVIDCYVNSILTANRAAGAAIVDRVYDALGKNIDQFYPKPYTKMEEFLYTLPPVFVVRPSQSSTKYAGVNYMIWGNTSHVLGATININGTFIGTDKLGHFFQQGHDYFKNGNNRPANERFGRSTEVGKYGLATTGVFSHADLEANRKGYDFYTALAANPNLTFRVANFVNRNWSEEYNPSSYGYHIAPQVWSNLLTGSWRGNFTDGAATHPITMTLKAGTDGSVSGRFSWSNRGGNVSGTLSGRYKMLTQRMSGTTFQNAVVSPALGLRYPKWNETVTGLLIEFTWTSGAKSGKGYWRTRDERRLQGEWVEGEPKLCDHWGGGTFPTYDGTWIMTR